MTVDLGDRLRRAIRTPQLLARGINRFYHRRLRSSAPTESTVFDEDWDNLIILDACRYDTFEKVSALPGELSVRRGRASSTVEFLRANVSGVDLYDTVYVTANPQYRKHFDGGRFHEVVDVWAETNWDEGVKTVEPGTLVERTLDVYERFDDKRLLVHFVQPHTPFLGEFGRAVVGDERLSFWRRVMEGELAFEDRDLYCAYCENLVLVLPHVRRLLETLDGKSVVTADHGQMIGERAWPIPIKEYGHPRGIYTSELVAVPWLEYESETRRSVTTGREATSSEVESSVVEDRLRDLGYG